MDGVVLLGPTHLSANNLGEGAMTLQRFVNKTLRWGGCRGGVLVIDEMTQVHIKLWHWLSVLKRLGCQFLIIRDGFFGLPVRNFFAIEYFVIEYCRLLLKN